MMDTLISDISDFTFVLAGLVKKYTLKPVRSTSCKLSECSTLKPIDLI